MPPVGDKKNLYDPVVEGAVIGLRPPSMTGSEVTLAYFFVVYTVAVPSLEY